MSSTGVGSFGVSEYDRLRQELSLDMDLEASEFSWGRGLEPSALSDASVAEGGRYRGTSPTCDVQIGISR